LDALVDDNKIAPSIPAVQAKGVAGKQKKTAATGAAKLGKGVRESASQGIVEAVSALKPKAALKALPAAGNKRILYVSVVPEEQVEVVITGNGQVT
jgi:hypothetical protein